MLGGVMNLQPLSQLQPIELIVSDIGNVMLLHKGEMQKDFCWAEYDEVSNKFQFITLDGELQELGLELKPEMKASLQVTNELFIFQVMEDGLMADPRIIKFTKVMN